MNIHLETERLILRDLEEIDELGMFELDSNPKVHRYLGNNPIHSREEALKSIRFVRNQYKKNGIGRWAIIDKESKDFIGWTGLKYEQNFRKELDYYDLGYRLKEKYWGKGIATETAIASLQYGFTTLELKEICAAAHIDHIASNTILKKVGLQFIEKFDYEGDPHNWYKITRSEWSKIYNI